MCFSLFFLIDPATLDITDFREKHMEEVDLFPAYEIRLLV